LHLICPSGKSDAVFGCHRTNRCLSGEPCFSGSLPVDVRTGGRAGFSRHHLPNRSPLAAAETGPVAAVETVLPKQSAVA
jgi:hypothetical protein